MARLVEAALGPFAIYSKIASPGVEEATTAPQAYTRLKEILGTAETE